MKNNAPYELKTVVTMPAATVISVMTYDSDFYMAVLTASSPCFCLLLELEQHVPSILIVVKVLDVIKDQHDGFFSPCRSPQRHLFEFVQCYGPALSEEIREARYVNVPRSISSAGPAVTVNIVSTAYMVFY